MAFTPITIEGQFKNADGSAASGTFVVTPNSVLVNAGEEQSVSPIVGMLDGLGRIVGQNALALVVNCTNDEGTTPLGSSYTFSLFIDGEGLSEFQSPVPVNGATLPGGGSVYDVAATTMEGSPVVTLVDLVASSTMVGAVLSGANFDGPVDVISVDVGANTVTVSANAGATGVDGNLVISGGAVPFTSLRANAL